MPLYRFVLEGPGGFRRSGTGNFQDKDEAERELLQREQRYVESELSSDRILVLEREHGPLVKKALALPAGVKLSREEAGQLPAAERARIAAHRQDKPYKLAKLTEAKGG